MPVFRSAPCHLLLSVTARQALRHPFFRDILEAEKRARAVEQVERGLGAPGAEELEVRLPTSLGRLSSVALNLCLVGVLCVCRFVLRAVS